MNYDISFLHTAHSHRAMFGELVDKQAAEQGREITVNHVVRESFLQHAQQGNDEQLKQDFTALVCQLSAESRVVVVTCSSIGALAEEFVPTNTCQIMRIDRAFADYAVTHAERILLVAALESTIEPTRQLLNSSAQLLSTPSNVDVLLVPQAWQYFLNGDMSGYHTCLIEELTRQSEKTDLVLLAQASMMGIEEKVQLSVPVISSPKLGVAKALALLPV